MEFQMRVQIVVDRTGDSRHVFDEADQAAVQKAEQRVKMLVEQGFTPAHRIATGAVEKLTHFDSSAEETLFFPRIVGG